MKKRQLGKTNLYVTEIGFGGASLGNLYAETSHQHALEVMNACWDLGIRYYDTAPEYGHGLSERRLGDALREKNAYILSTKVGDLLNARHDILPAPNKFINKLPFHLQFDYSYDGVLRAFEDSLQRLGLNKIDILFVHDLDPIIHSEKKFQEHFKIYVEGGYKALAQLREEGVIQALGLGVKQWEVCQAALNYGSYECFMLQGNYTLLEQPALNGFMQRCEEDQISILLAGPFASGILATGAKQGAYFHHKEADEKILSRVRFIEKICAEFAVPLQAAAIQFPLLHKAIASVVIGSSSAISMRKNIDFYNYPIPKTFWHALKSEKIIPENAPVEFIL